MKRLSLFLSVLSITWMASAQPEWLDPKTRLSNWPEEQYLTAFGTEVLGKKQSESEAQSKLFEIIKGQISDAILVSINAQTSLNITIENAATDERLERKSASSSEVELVGLKLDSYYNKRKKSLYAFGYVSIPELAAYHRQNISDKSTRIDQNLKRAASGINKTEQIRLYVENKSLLSDIQKSARLLTALSEPLGTDLSGLRKIGSRNNEQLERLFHEGTITVEHLVTRISGELLNALPQGTDISVAKQSLTYANSGVASEFSMAVIDRLATSLSASDNVTLSASAGGSLAGSFVQNESETTFDVGLSAGQEVLSATRVNVSTSVIDTKGIRLLPPNFEYIPVLSDLSIAAPSAFSIKPSEYTTRPLIVSYSLEDRPVPNMAVSLSIEKDGKAKTYPTTTNADGQVVFNLDESMVIPGNEYLVRADIDLGRFLSVEPGNEFLDYIRDDQHLPTYDIALTVRSPTVFIASVESGLEGPLAVKVLEPAVKAGLAELRYAFITDRDQADYVLSIEAQARKGQSGEIATLTFIDATISLVNRLNGKEVYKNSFFNVKGVGSNYETAQSNAFQKVRKQMVDDITYELEYKR